MNEEQTKYGIKKVEEYRKEADKADRKGFWELLAANASLVLIGIDAYLGLFKPEILRADIALAIGVALGVIRDTLKIESIRNSNMSSDFDTSANLLEDQIGLSNVADEEEVVVRRTKRR